MDDLTLPEADLLALSQALKADIAALRDRRRAIARELSRRHQAHVIRAKLGELTPEERAMLRDELEATP